jgi:hypothetical protein
MATIAITVSKNLRDRLGEEGVQEFVSILNQINTTQMEEMERLNGRTYEKFQRELAHHRELLSSQIDHIGEHIKADDPSRNVNGQPIPSWDEIFAKNKTILLRWMFFFWATTILTILVGYFIK